MPRNGRQLSFALASNTGYSLARRVLFLILLGLALAPLRSARSQVKSDQAPSGTERVSPPAHPEQMILKDQDDAGETTKELKTRKQDPRDPTRAVAAEQTPVVTPTQEAPPEVTGAEPIPASGPSDLGTMTEGDPARSDGPEAAPGEEKEDEALIDMSLEEILELDINVVSATRRENALSEAPARMIVITKAQIQRRSYRHLRDVFRDLPGYQASYLSTSEWGTSLMVRGVGGNHRLVFLLDGQRMNPPGGEEVPLFENYPLAFVDHVEIMYGPGSSLYGNDAFNGVVNLVTKPETPVNDVQFSAIYGMYDHGELQGRWTQHFKELELTAGLHYTGRNHPDFYSLYPGEHSFSIPGGASDVRLDQMTPSNLTIGSFWAPENGFDALLEVSTAALQLTLYHRSYSLSSAWDRNALGAPFVKGARFGDNSQLVTGRYTGTLGAFTSTTYLSYSRYQIDPEARSILPNDNTFQSFALDDYRGGLSSSFRAEEKLDWDILPKKLVLTAGVSLQDVFAMPSSVFSDRWDPGGSLLGDQTSYTYFEYTAAGDFPGLDGNRYVLDNNPQLFGSARSLVTGNIMEFQIGGLFSQVSWNAHPLFNLTAGFRADYSSRFGYSINPRVAILSSITDSTAVKLLYGRAYLEPTSFEIYGAFVTNDQILLPNPDLEPEVLHSLELVLTQNIGNYLQVTTGAFFNLINELIQASSWQREYVYVQTEDGRLRQHRLLQSINSGTGSFVGSETQALFSAGMFRTYLSFSWVYGKTDKINAAGEVKESTPHGLSTFNVKAGVHVAPLDGLDIDVRGTFQDAPFISFSQTTYPYAGEGESFFVLDATIRYQLKDLWKQGHHLTVFVTGSNLTDARYKLQSGRPSVNPIGAPQPSLEVLGGLEIELGL